jgi:hypothetical protein
MKRINKLSDLYTDHEFYELLREISGRNNLMGNEIKVFLDEMAAGKVLGANGRPAESRGDLTHAQHAVAAIITLRAAEFENESVEYFKEEVRRLVSEWRESKKLSPKQ